MGTRNEDLAAGTGQDSTVKEPAKADEQATGSYQDNITPGSLEPSGQPASTVNPLGGLKGGR